MAAKPRRLPPPTMFERADAAEAARALRLALADPATMGERSAMFIDYSRRRGEVYVTWANLPGFSQVNGRFQHQLLPGWEYTRAELAAEMIPDLVALAERGERPTVATGAAEADVSHGSRPHP